MSASSFRFKSRPIEQSQVREYEQLGHVCVNRDGQWYATSQRIKPKKDERA